MEFYWFIILAVIAFLYSSVGHGGASGYLALMAIMGVEIQFMRSTALSLNLFVAGIAFINYAKRGYFDWKILLPFIITSIPMAYFGAIININPETYKIILGVFLLLATLRMIVKPGEREAVISFSWPIALFLGAALGLFSGIIGIGGGIILTPVLVLLGWANVKKAAAISAAFIFLNSASGLFGVFQGNFQLVPNFFAWIVIGVIAGLFGSYLGSKKMSLSGLQYVLAGILILASIKLFIF